MATTSHWIWGVYGGVTLSVGACVSPAGYSGMGVLNISGEPALLTPVAVKLATCVLPAPDDASAGSAGPLGGASSADPSSYDVLSISPGCRLPGITSYGNFRLTAQVPCTLDFAEGRRTIQVTSASLRFLRRPGTLCGSLEDCHVDVEIAGEDLASGKPMLFQFQGTGIDKDPDPASCPSRKASQSPTAATD